MPTSQVKQEGVVLSNGTNYVSLHSYFEKKDTTGVTEDYYYWLQSTSSGSPTGKRNNAINGFFPTKELALDNFPDGYGDLPPTDEFQNRREWGYKPDYPFDSGFVAGGDNISLNNAFNDIAQYVNAGATYIGLTLFWDDVFLSLDAQNTNADASWARYDAFVNYVKNINSTVKLSIRVAVFKAGRTHNDMQGTYNPTGNLWPLSKAQRDSAGNVMRIQNDNGTFSYADSAAVSQAIDFVTKVKNRYSSPTFMGSRLHWISVATTTQEEAGYDYENQWSGDSTGYYPSPVKEVYDYSDAAKTGFEAAMLSKYGSLSAVNAAWGLSASTPITPPQPPAKNTDEAISLVYSGIKGNDWWYYHASLMEAFHISCKSNVEPTCKYVLEFGSCSDPLSVRRLSINVAQYATFSSMIKAQFGSWPSLPDSGISLDVVRSNYTKKIGTELNTGDFKQALGEGNVFNFIKNGGVSAIDNGALDILIISSSTSGAWNKQAYDDTYDAFLFLKNYAQSSSIRVTATKTVNYSIWQQLNDSTFLLRKWQQEGGQTSRINLKIANIDEPTIDPTIFKSVFTFNQKTNGNPVPSSGNYVNGYLLFEAFSHGIVFKVPDPVGAKVGLQCKLEYTIRNAANEIVINLKDNYGGFHPNYRPFAGDADNSPAESYYRVWTPSHPDYPNLAFIRDFYNGFTPISGTPFADANDRGNNHFDQYSKYFPEGTYTITIKNTGVFPFQLRAGKTSVFNTPNLADVYTTIPADNIERTFTLNVQNFGVGEAYKINAFID